LIFEDFTFETASGAVQSSPRWTLATGASPGMTWGGANPPAGTVYAQIGSAASFAAHTTAPTRANQAVEITATYGTGASTMFTGAFLRYKDASNYILAQVSHTGSKQMTVIERIAGTSTTLLTLSAPATGTVAAIKIELIGSRVRAWYDVGSLVDRPPDSAANLAGDPTIVGSWGIYLDGNGTNTMKLTSFAARMLPRAVMAPPMLTMTGASGLNLTAVTLTAATVGTATQIEWEVLPSDPADFPEPYRAITDVGITSHVVWVRPGYTYQARVRSLNTAPGPWSPYVPVGPVGSAGGTGWTSHGWQLDNWPTRVSGTAGDVTPPAAPDTFPAVVPDWVLETSDTASPILITSSTGKDRVAAIEQRPRRGFKFSFDNRQAAEYQLLISFFEAMQAKTRPFNWTHPITGEVFILRFNSDDYTEDYQAYDAQSGSPIAQIAFDVVETTMNVVPVYTFRLLADSSL
jgi:hypothetical protein